MDAPLLEVRGLRVEFGPAAAPFAAVDGVDLCLQAGELLGIVGESGSGKSVAMLALMGLIDPPGRVQADVMRFGGRDLMTMAPRERRQVLGRDIAMVFQDPLNSLNPAYTVGDQLRETLRVQLGLRGRDQQRRAVDLFEQVEIADARRRLDAYPHQLSGGMNQRVMIAIAIACGPRLLIADEPTTALDVTTQAQVMSLLARLQADTGMGLVLISHDLALVAGMARRVAVMYAGQLVEEGTVDRVLGSPRHPYTAALLAALPEAARGARRLSVLPGIVPGRLDRPRGCLFAPRCDHAVAACSAARPTLTQGVRCIAPLGAGGA